jgi:Bifunctional DNA primase/polymerase, N-terminal
VNDAQRASLSAACKIGLPAFPCHSDKRPASPRGFKDAALPESGLATLWARHPGELIGVPTGAISGFDVLDVDPRHGGRIWYDDHRHKLPATRIHRTRSGGLHVLFKHCEGLRNSAGKIAPGVDVRGDGGYLVWWPAEGLEVREHSLTDLPQWPLWLLPSLMNPPKAPEPVYPKSQETFATLPSIEGLVRAVATAPLGQRNAVTYWAAHRMRENVQEGKIGEALARDILIEAAFRAGLPTREAALTINSAMRGRGRG